MASALPPASSRIRSSSALVAASMILRYYTGDRTLDLGFSAAGERPGAAQGGELAVRAAVLAVSRRGERDIGGSDLLQQPVDHRLELRPALGRGGGVVEERDLDALVHRRAAQEEEQRADGAGRLA